MQERPGVRALLDSNAFRVERVLEQPGGGALRVDDE